MTDQHYTALRAQLIAELWREIAMHHRLTARARIRRIAALGLNYNSTVSKMKEDAASGIDTEKDGLTKLLVEARDSMNEVPEL